MISILLLGRGRRMGQISSRKELARRVASVARVTEQDIKNSKEYTEEERRARGTGKLSFETARNMSRHGREASN